MKKLLSRNAQKIIIISMQKCLREQNPNQLAGNFALLAYSSRYMLILLHIFLIYTLNTCIHAYLSLIKIIKLHRFLNLPSKQQEYPISAKNHHKIAFIALVLLSLFLISSSSCLLSLSPLPHVRNGQPNQIFGLAFGFQNFPLSKVLGACVAKCPIFQPFLTSTWNMFFSFFALLMAGQHKAI